MRIALVEDDVTLANNYQELFGRAKWQVTHFEDRLTAMTHIMSSAPDLAIIDVGLGAEEEGGFQLCRQLRATPETERLPIIMLTARGDQSDKVFGLNLGADEYCTKDESTDYLIAVINKLFRRIEMDRRSPTEERIAKSVGELQCQLCPGASR